MSLINNKNFIPFSEIEKKWFADPKFKKVYDELQPKYDLIRKILDKRLEKNMTQAQLAKKVGTGQSAIARLETPGSNPSFKFLLRVAKALDSKLEINFR